MTFWLNLDLIFYHRQPLKRFPDQSEVSVLPTEYCMVDLTAQVMYFTDMRLNSGFYGQMLVFNYI